MAVTNIHDTHESGEQFADQLIAALRDPRVLQALAEAVEQAHILDVQRIGGAK